MTTFATSRHFTTTPKAIFDAFRDSERLARWWGPNGFRNRIELFDFQTGGQWHFDMIGPDGTIYPNRSVFSVIDEHNTIVIDHVCEPFFQLTITLEPSHAGTTLHWQQRFPDDSVAEAIRHIVEPANEQNLDRLECELGLR